MKTKTFLFIVISLFLLMGGAGCEKEALISDLYHTWKLEGIGDLSNNSFEKANPSNCENCYTITFVKDGMFSGFTASNSFYGEYQIEVTKLKVNNFTATKVFELGNGEKYSQAIPQIVSFETTKNELKLYYNQGQNYLLFNLLK